MPEQQQGAEENMEVSPVKLKASRKSGQWGNNSNSDGSRRRGSWCCGCEVAPPQSAPRHRPPNANDGDTDSFSNRRWAVGSRTIYNAVSGREGRRTGEIGQGEEKVTRLFF